MPPKTRREWRICVYIALMEIRHAFVRDTKATLSKLGKNIGYLPHDSKIPNPRPTKYVEPFLKQAIKSFGARCGKLDTATDGLRQKYCRRYAQHADVEYFNLLVGASPYFLQRVGLAAKEVDAFRDLRPYHDKDLNESVAGELNDALFEHSKWYRGVGGWIPESTWKPPMSEVSCEMRESYYSRALNPWLHDPMWLIECESKDVRPTIDANDSDSTQVLKYMYTANRDKENRNEKDQATRMTQLGAQLHELHERRPRHRSDRSSSQVPAGRSSRSRAFDVVLNIANASSRRNRSREASWRVSSLRDSTTYRGD